MPSPREGPISAGREEGCGQEELGHRRYHLRWAEGSRQAFLSSLFQARSAPLWGPSQGSVPRRREENGRKGWAAHSPSESESVKTTVAETRSKPFTEESSTLRAASCPSRDAWPAPAPQPSGHCRGQMARSSSKGQGQPFQTKARQQHKGIWGLRDLGQVP